MPRGGRRPGAGAPKGNFNGVRLGRSPRFMVAYYVLANHPDLRAVAKMLYRAGFFPPPSHAFNGDLRGAFQYLWSVWFDCADPVQSNVIKRNQSLAARMAAIESAAAVLAPLTAAEE